MNNVLTYGYDIDFWLWFILLLENMIRITVGMVAGIILYKLFNRRKI